MPTDRVHHLPQQPHLRATPAHTPQPTAPDTATATRPRNARPSSTRESLHPLRRTTPVTSHCTHYVALHPNRRGVMPTDRVHLLPQQPQLRATPPHTPCPAVPDAATQPRDALPSSGLATQQKRSRNYTRYGALHPLRSAAPERKGCNADGSGAVPPRQEQKRAALCQQLNNVARAVPRSCRKLGGAPRCPPSSDTTDQRTVSIPHQVVTGRGRCSAALRH